jgi:hypothetical protein
MKALLVAGLLSVGAAASARAQQATTQGTEAQTLARGVVLRRSGEADSVFLRRVLPVSYPASEHRIAYAWRPSTFGKQLLFAVTGGNGVASSIVVLDPYQPATYAVQQLAVVLSGDCDMASILSALFFADTNHDGQKELLAIGACAALEPSDYKDENGQTMLGHVERQGTVVYRYVGLDKVGRPHYEEVSTPHYLVGVETAAEARAEIAAHQWHRPALPRADNKSK